MPIVRFTKDEFEEILNSIKENWHSYFEHGEWRYRLSFGEHGIIYVASSVGYDKIAKTVGDDSIRVWVEYDGRALKKSQRWTTRIPGWENRLRDRISEACKIINDYDYSPRCPLCGSAMALRSGVHGKFYGCIHFPRCRGTRNYEEKIPQELEWLKQ